jgi:oligopeptide transport system permease protein
MRTLWHLLGRLGEALVTLWLIFTLSFLLVRFAPGSPFDRDRPLPEAVRARLEARYGLDRPLAEQYLTTLAGFARFDFGESLSRPGEGSAGRMLAESLPVSLELGAWGFLVALAYALAMALAATLARGGRLRAGLRLASQVGLVVPVIVLGPLLVNLFAVRLGWLPPGGFEGAASRVLPALCLGLVYGAVFFRLFQGGLDDAVAQPWFLFLQVLGVPRRRVVLRHALPASLSPFVSFLGPALSSLLTGSFVVERVFNIPGLSVHFMDAAANRDYPVILAVVVVYAVLLLGLNLASEVLLEVLDPRVRRGSHAAL